MCVIFRDLPAGHKTLSNRSAKLGTVFFLQMTVKKWTCFKTESMFTHEESSDRLGVRKFLFMDSQSISTVCYLMFGQEIRKDS